jgi:hypothetical protein
MIADGSRFDALPAFFYAQRNTHMLNFSKILEHFGHLYGDLPVPILIFDQHRIVCRANNAFCRLIEQDSVSGIGI